MRAFKQIQKPSQALVFNVGFMSELGLCEYLEVSRGYGDEDDCYRVGKTRTFQIDHQRGNAFGNDWQEWFSDEWFDEQCRIWSDNE